jgi:hypothetical protein
MYWSDGHDNAGDAGDVTSILTDQVDTDTVFHSLAVPDPGLLHDTRQ